MAIFFTQASRKLEQIQSPNFLLPSGAQEPLFFFFFNVTPMWNIKKMLLERHDKLLCEI